MNIGLFVEDDGHAALIGPLVQRIAEEESAAVNVEVRSSAGGAPIVASSFRRYLADLAAGRAPYFDLVVIAVDGNCRGWHRRRKEVDAIVARRAFAGRHVVAIPDPHVEVWYLADRRSPARVVGESHEADVPVHKCERHRYKAALRRAFVAAGIRPSAGGIEYGDAIAKDMDLGVAVQNDESLRRFLDDLRSALR